MRCICINITHLICPVCDTNDPRLSTTKHQIVLPWICQECEIVFDSQLISRYKSLKLIRLVEFCGDFSHSYTFVIKSQRFLQCGVTFLDSRIDCGSHKQA